MIPKFSDAVTIEWDRRDLEFKTVLTVRFYAALQYHIKDGDEVDFEEVKDSVVEQLRLDVANSVGGMLATAERETLVRRIDELCAEVEQLKGENAKLREFANEMFKEILLLTDYQMGGKRKKHFIDKGIELGLRGYA